MRLFTPLSYMCADALTEARMSPLFIAHHQTPDLIVEVETVQPQGFSLAVHGRTVDTGFPVTFHEPYHAPFLVYLCTVVPDGAVLV